MAKCDTCGNECDRTLALGQGDRSATFDSLECALQAYAPDCERCGSRHSESQGALFGNKASLDVAGTKDSKRSDLGRPELSPTYVFVGPSPTASYISGAVLPARGSSGG